MVRVEVERAGPDRIRFAVLDDGQGFAVEERERVFERFHRTDPARNRAARGAGLGVAIVRAIARRGGLRARPRARLGRQGPTVLPGFTPV